MFKSLCEIWGDNDIALIKASTQLIDPHTICLPEQNADPSNKNVIITGWGIHQKYGKSTTQYLQVAETELFPEEFCNYMIEFTNIGFIRFNSDGTKVCVYSEIYSESNSPCSVRTRLPFKSLPNDN